MSTKQGHKPDGDPCSRCGLPATKHRRDRSAYFQARRAQLAKVKRRAAPKARHTSGTPLSDFLAIDGEGWTDEKTNEHHYAYLAACSTHGLVSELHVRPVPHGLSEEDRKERLRENTKEILDWLLALPKKPKKITYSHQYDLAKWLEGLDDETLYMLWRPDHPRRERHEHGARSLAVTLGGQTYAVNMLSTRFTVHGERERNPATRKWRWKRSTVVRDLFRFFGKSFVAALEEWGVGTEDERAAIKKMKDARGSFRGISVREQLYCQHECRLLSALAEKLFAACADADLPLSREFFGPGTLAKVMLEREDAKAQIVDLSKNARLRDAVQRGFFAGRFEVSKIGPIARAESYDVASAFPAAEATMLPCFKCGTWKHVKGERAVLAAMRASKVALVRWHLHEHESIPIVGDYETFAAMRDVDLKTWGITQGDLGSARVSSVPWGPLPFRTSKGAIVFPVVCPSGGWAWHPEIRAVLAHPELWNNLRVSEAWIFVAGCKHRPPFKKGVVRAYIKRLEWGKEGRGLTVKLATNSRYGVRAQGIGEHPFRCLASAGIITSTVRAQILDAIALARDPRDVISVSTDGIITTRPIKLPTPPKTGTEAAARAATRREKKKRYPLGAWEHKPLHDGVHIIRPGLRFSLADSAKMSTTAARGLGIKVLHDNRAQVIAKWKREPAAKLELQQPRQFFGAKTSITETLPIIHASNGRRARSFHFIAPHEEGKGRDAHEGRAWGDEQVTVAHRRSPRYGKWEKPDPYRVSYEPAPKRPAAAPDHSLYTWVLGDDVEPSAPYSRHASGEFNEDLKEASDRAEEQPEVEE